MPNVNGGAADAVQGVPADLLKLAETLRKKAGPDPSPFTFEECLADDPVAAEYIAKAIAGTDAGTYVPGKIVDLARIRQRREIYRWATAYATAGWPVFPITPNGKEPLPRSKGFYDATTDLAVIDKWFAGDDGPAYNIALLPEGAGLCVVDVDPGAAPLELPEGPRASTPRGGSHHFYSGSLPPTQSKLAEHVDTRGRSSYVLLPPSVVDGKPYTWQCEWPFHDFDCPAVPEWIVEKCKPTVEERRIAGDYVEDKPEAIRLAGIYLSLQDQPVDGAGSDGQCYAVAARLLDFGLSTDCVAEMMGEWSGFDPDWLLDKINHAETYRQNERGSDVPTSSQEAFGAAVAAGVTGAVEQPREAPGIPANDMADGVTLDQFRAYMPMHSYLFTASNTFWPAASINSRLPPMPLIGDDGEPVLDNKGNPVRITASSWLDRNKPIEQLLWAPGLPLLIPDKLLLEGGWVDHRGINSFNLYRPPIVSAGDASKAGPWVEHVKLIYPDDAEHIFNWLAHRVQKPGEKINHALMLGGAPGIGKDTLLHPARYAVGEWNCQEVSPKQVNGRFNGFLKSVILRINEARDLGTEGDRFQLYEHLKAYLAAPPETLRVDEKHISEYHVVNCVGVIITTNHKTDGIYLPADDRRHYVAWSDRTAEQLPPGHCQGLWEFYKHAGSAHVASWLRERDISGFDAKASPPKTEAFWAIASANRAPELDDLAMLIDGLGNPDAFWLEQLQDASNEPGNGEVYRWLHDRDNRRKIPHRLDDCGYAPVRNKYQTDGRWKFKGKNCVAYARKTLSFQDQVRAVEGAMAAAKDRG